jgi:hypothetical protein
MENRAKLIKENPNLSITDVAKQNGEAWKATTNEQRKKFDELVKKDTDRHNKEMKEFQETGFFTNSDGINSKFMTKKHRVQEFVKGTVLPKQAKTAFMCFSIEKHAEYKSQMKEGEKY